MQREIYMKPEIRMRFESSMLVNMKNIPSEVHGRLGSTVLSSTSTSSLTLEAADASETMVHLHGFTPQKKVIFKF
jgi:hypothetical protein